MDETQSVYESGMRGMARARREAVVADARRLIEKYPGMSRMSLYKMLALKHGMSAHYVAAIISRAQRTGKEGGGDA